MVWNVCSTTSIEFIRDLIAWIQLKYWYIVLCSIHYNRVGEQNVHNMYTDGISHCYYFFAVIIVFVIKICSMYNNSTNKYFSINFVQTFFCTYFYVVIFFRFFFYYVIIAVSSGSIVFGGWSVKKWDGRRWRNRSIKKWTIHRSSTTQWPIQFGTIYV